MTRKKVKSEPIITDTPKKRLPDPEPKKNPIKPADDTPSRWDKIKGINGQIVRHKMGDSEKGVEMGKLIQQNKARRLCVARDGNYMYFYFEIFKE